MHFLCLCRCCRRCTAAATAAAAVQADAGAQVVQIFDSWASHLSPQDFDVFSGPYIKKVSIICSVKWIEC
jgi:uroporphyrinogen-III decarboxylase